MSTSGNEYIVLNNTSMTVHIKIKYREIMVRNVIISSFAFYSPLFLKKKKKKDFCFITKVLYFQAKINYLGR